MDTAPVSRWAIAAIVLVGAIAAGAVVAYRAGLFSSKPAQQLVSDATSGSRSGAADTNRNATARSEQRSDLALNALGIAGAPVAQGDRVAGISAASGLGFSQAGGDSFAIPDFPANSSANAAASTGGNNVVSSASSRVAGGASIGTFAAPGRSFAAGGTYGAAATIGLPFVGSSPTIVSAGAPTPAGGDVPIAQPASINPPSNPNPPVVALAPAGPAPQVIVSPPKNAAPPPSSASLPVSSSPATDTRTPPAAISPPPASGPAPSSPVASSAPTGSAGGPPSSAPIIVATAPANITPPLPSDPRDFIQTGGKTVIDNVLNVDSVDIEGGRLGGRGLIQAGTVTIGPGGTLGPGNSPGILSITTPNLDIKGLLEIEIAGTDNSGATPQYDVLNVTGTATFEKGSVLKFIFYTSYTQTNGDQWEFLTTTNGLFGLDQVTFTTVGLADDFDYQVYEEGEKDLYVRIFSRATGSGPADADQTVLYEGRPDSVVPEPSSVALGLLGLTLLGWRARRHGALSA